MLYGIILGLIALLTFLFYQTKSKKELDQGLLDNCYVFTFEDESVEPVAVYVHGKTKLNEEQIIEVKVDILTKLGFDATKSDKIDVLYLGSMK